VARGELPKGRFRVDAASPFVLHQLVPLLESKRPLRQDARKLTPSTTARRRSRVELRRLLSLSSLDYRCSLLRGAAILSR
jgi:hypothetical protein